MQLGTFLHELGHTLGLLHGGDDNYQYKPNYYSVMNYTWQLPHKWMNDHTRPMEVLADSSYRDAYSDHQMNTLNESSLVETTPFGNTPDKYADAKTIFSHPQDANGNTVGFANLHATDVNWNQDSQSSGGYAQNINKLKCVSQTDGDYPGCTGLFHLGLVLKDLRRFDEAETLIREGLNDIRRLRGDDERGTAYAQHCLAMVYLDAGDLTRAESVCRDALDLHLRAWSPGHGNVARPMTDLGQILVLLGRYEEAEGHLLRALAIRIDRKPPGHWKTAKTRSILGAALAGAVRRGRAAVAEQLLYHRGQSRRGQPAHARGAGPHYRVVRRMGPTRGSRRVAEEKGEFDMTTKLVTMVAIMSIAIVSSPCRADEPDRPRFQRPVATYSIVARDPDTGEMGVAVQSHWFSVGSVVSWAEAGVGAVATQSLVDPAYGPLGLDLIRAGRSGPDALRSLLAGDDGRDVRQVAMIDTQGRVAAHTGDKCIAAAGQVVDTDHQFSVQANLMTDNTIWPAMAQAYRESDGDLADRLLAALEAAQSAGGDIRGRQSAALVIVSATSTGRPWIDRKFDLRIEDHPRPIEELKRLVRLQRAYLHMNAGDVALEHGEFALASREYAAAETLAPEIVEIPFWHAVTLAANDQVEASLPIFRRVFAREPVWADLVERLVPSGILPDNPELLKRIDAQK